MSTAANIGIKISLDGAQQTEADIRRVTNSVNMMGMSAGQMANNMRMLPMQLTDIVTGLASGQAPLTVLLQQGGQLKDTFGGVGNAARALGGYVAGLVNPFTLAAAAGGAYHVGTGVCGAGAGGHFLALIRPIYLSTRRFALLAGA